VIKVLVVDDQDLIRAGLAALIQAAPGMEVVGQAADGPAAVALAASTAPDVILMDIWIPGIDGVAATERILSQARDPRPRVLILTILDSDESVYGALHAGASGFLLKETRPEQVLRAIQVAAAGDSLFGPTATRRLIEGCTARHTVSRPRALDCLTPRELEVIRLVATGASNAEIARRLGLTEATVKTHLNRAMSNKLSLNSRAQVVVFAYENGLVTPGNGGADCSP
jgi:DNA-binding NarL/FixJ family response regulator